MEKHSDWERGECLRDSGGIPTERRGGSGSPPSARHERAPPLFPRMCPPIDAPYPDRDNGKGQDVTLALYCPQLPSEPRVLNASTKIQNITETPRFLPFLKHRALVRFAVCPLLPAFRSTGATFPSSTTLQAFNRATYNTQHISRSKCAENPRGRYSSSGRSDHIDKDPVE